MEVSALAPGPRALLPTYLLAYTAGVQEDLTYLEASEDDNEELYGGGGKGRRLEHFPAMWCPTELSHQVARYPINSHQLFLLT